jgi:hypothetical protein
VGLSGVAAAAAGCTSDVLATAVSAMRSADQYATPLWYATRDACRACRCVKRAAHSPHVQTMDQYNTVLHAIREPLPASEWHGKAIRS